jgi:excisionase family DNA binding protein
MQAYARAEFPLTSQCRLEPVPSVEQAARHDVNRAEVARFDNIAPSASIVASLILDGLDDQGLAILAQLLLPHLRPGQPESTRGQAAYTVASLATELGVSQKTIRCAIARPELPAVKRGSRWIISAEAVHSWATAPERRRTRRPCGAAAPKSAGPLLRSVLCGGAGQGGSR